jgi:peptidyl-prolyl cis-trans isomerase C
MTKKPIAALLAVLLTTGIGQAQDTTQETAPAGDVNIATVNGTPYSLELFRMFYMERMQETQHQNDEAFQQQAFNEFMSLVVASQEAEKRKLQDDPGVTTALELQRLKVLSNAAVAAMSREIEVSDEELKQAYEQVKKQAERTEYKARHILVKDEGEAKKLIKELDKKADFAELAKKHSLGPTAKNGGELEWFDQSQMVQPFASAVAAMKPGTYSKEPVQTQFGWHVIELEETRMAEPPAFEDIKPQLTAMVQRQKIGEQLMAMRDKALVELNEDIVKVKPKDEAAPETPKPEEDKGKAEKQ